MATPNQGFLRDITIETMMNYAKTLYDRGDYKEARNVIARVKELSPVTQLTKKVHKKNAKKQAMCCMVPVKPKAKPIATIVVPSDSNDDLRQAIAQEDRILSELNHDVSLLRTQIQATNHE